MTAFHRIVDMTRLIRGLMAGQDGEDLIAQVRDAQEIDPAPLFRTAAAMVVMTAAAFGVAGIVIAEESPLTAAVHHISSLADL